MDEGRPSEALKCRRLTRLQRSIHYLAINKTPIRQWHDRALAEAIQQGTVSLLGPMLVEATLAHDALLGYWHEEAIDRDPDHPEYPWGEVERRHKETMDRLRMYVPAGEPPEKTSTAGDATDRPPGWFFKSKPPGNVAELIEWLATRTAWMHQSLVGPASSEFMAEIIREVDGSKGQQNHVFVYAQRLWANIRFWLDHHQISGSPVWLSDNNDPRQLVKADEQLSALLSFLRERSQPAGKIPSPPQEAVDMPDDPITLLEMAKLGMMGTGTFRNWGTAGRPKPCVAQRGRRAAVFSYRELRPWFLKKQPDKESCWPEDYKTARATLARMSK